MSAHLFSMVPKVNIQRSSFSMPFSHKTTCSAGRLIPIFFKDVIPGDTFNLKTSIFARMATLISPIMDELYINTFYFFVPYRLVWNNFQKFMGEQEDPGDSVDFVVPSFAGANETFAVQAESVCDYFGLPLGALYGGSSTSKLDVSALPFRAYCLIWNEWFRSENLQDSIKINKGDTAGYRVNDDGPFNSFVSFGSSGSCLPIGKLHDYYTSALPWVLKDGSSVDVPLGGEAPVTGLSSVGVGSFNVPYSSASWSGYYAGGAQDSNVGPVVSGTDPSFIGNKSLNLSNFASSSSELVADLSKVYALTVNSLRESFQVQRFLERAARSGTRYTEILRGFFGCISPDARLQRPEYLGGTVSRMDVNIVPQTSGSVDGATPQANLAAFVTGVNTNRDGFTKSFVEHGMLIGLLAIRGPLLYQQGVERYWRKKTRFDFYWPTFAHLGEQAILNSEIYAQGTSVDDDVFGYQERYAEYRYSPSYITGKFRSTYSQPLDYWHLGQKFDSLPTLSSQFIMENPPISRVIAVPSEPQFLVDIHFDLKCARPMPLYGVPGLIDHF